MKKTTLAMSAAVLAMAGTAVYAAAPEGPARGADMTRAQVVAKANEAWAAMDVNKDNVVNQADRDAMRTQMFDRIDTNKDGSISRDEFNAAHPAGGYHGGGMDKDAGHQGMNHDGPGHRHGAMDGKMGSGKMGGKMGHHMMGKMLLGMADANKDGSVTRAEFDAAVSQHIDKVDANKDGTITAAERRAAHAEMMKHMPMKQGQPPRPAGQ